jgi:hypothetical protein
MIDDEKPRKSPYNKNALYAGQIEKVHKGPKWYYSLTAAFRAQLATSVAGDGLYVCMTMIRQEK